MKKKSVFFSILFSFFLLIVLSICLFLNLNRNSVRKSGHLKSAQDTYLFPVKISKFTAANQPCLDIEIDGNLVSAMLDLGFRGQFGLSSDFLKNLGDKIHVGSIGMYGIRGTEYRQNIFKTSQVSIGPVIFFNPEIYEYDDICNCDSSLFNNASENSRPEPGKLGWEIFRNTNIFLDLKNFKIIFCDSLATLKKQGYKVKEFIKVPLVLDRGLVEFRVKTTQGWLLCMLDTGATWNVLNKEVNTAAEIQNKLEVYQSFKIGSKDFGPIGFHPFQLKMPIQVDAILGMEFFENHYVFLDFYKGYAYFMKNN